MDKTWSVFCTSFYLHHNSPHFHYSTCRVFCIIYRYQKKVTKLIIEKESQRVNRADSFRARQSGDPLSSTISFHKTLQQIIPRARESPVRSSIYPPIDANIKLFRAQKPRDKMHTGSNRPRRLSTHWPRADISVYAQSTAPTNNDRLCMTDII